MSDQQFDAMERDPAVECDGCGEEFRASHYDSHGQLSADPERDTLCARCNGLGVPKTVEQRQEENAQLTGWEEQ